MKPVTMQQLADELGLDRTTVSYIINNRAKKRGIPAATIKRVTAYMQERGYVPSRQAVNLKNRVRKSTGILYCGHLYSHLVEAFNRITDNFNGTPERMEILVISRANLIQGVRELLARGVSRLVWIHTQESETEFADPAVFNYLAHFTRVVIYNYRFKSHDNSRELGERGFHLVGVNRFNGYRAVARFLKALGHRRILLPDYSYDFGTAPGPVAARKRIYDTEGLVPYVPLKQWDTTLSLKDNGAYCAREIIGYMEKERITAACFSSDTFAAYTIAELKRLGTGIPEDITITGYDGMPFGEFLTPPLTTLAVPVTPMVECVRNVLAKGGTQHRHCFGLELVKRGTHGHSNRKNK